MSDKPHPSPMRLLGAWVFRERAVRGPASFELDVVGQQIERERQAVRACAREAAGIETRAARLRHKMRAALTDRVSPGVIDDEESRGMAGDLITLTVKARHHTKSLEALT